MVNGRRSQIKIINDILLISREGAKKTDILYKGNLSYKQLQQYLKYMINNNILEEVNIQDNGNSCRLYRPTDKGLDFLKDSSNLLKKLLVE